MPSRIMRELLLLSFLFTSIRYTLTYNEGTIRAFCANILNMIHPHIQWGNRFFREFMRQPQRYTLTYSEGTCRRRSAFAAFSIHPHIQWGNWKKCSAEIKWRDTPSHTVREHPAQPLHECNHRYTLTYSEGTSTAIFIMPSLTIHPHIQWGNDISFKQLNHINDTPSHTVREPQYLRGFQPLQIHRCAICTKAFCHPRHIFNMPKNLIC